MPESESNDIEDGQISEVAETMIIILFPNSAL